MLFRYGRISKRPADMQSSKKLEFEYKGRYVYVLLIKKKSSTIEKNKTMISKEASLWRMPKETIPTFFL